MKKTILLMLTAFAMAASAQNTPTDSTYCQAPSGICPHRHRAHPERDGNGPARHGRRGKGKHNLMFLRELNEADRATVKEVMGRYHQERKAIAQKYKVDKPAPGTAITEELADARIKARMACRIEKMQLKEKYYGILRKTLKPRQAAALLDLNDGSPRRPRAEHRPWHRGRHRRR